MQVDIPEKVPSASGRWYRNAARRRGGAEKRGGGRSSALDLTPLTRYCHPMRPLLSVVLLLLQLGPFAGAGICMHAAAQPRAECSMPMNGMPHDDRQ